MSEALALQYPFLRDQASPADCLRTIREQFAFLRLPATPSAPKKLVSSQPVVAQITDISDDLVVKALRSGDAGDFRAVRKKLLPLYAKTVLSIAELSQVVVRGNERARLASESFDLIEAAFRIHGESLGEAVREQALFTVYTFRQIDSLISEKLLIDAPDDKRSEDSELARQFASAVIWTRFHLHCLTLALNSSVRLSEPLREVVADGLRAAVNAYAYAKQGARLRESSQDSAPSLLAWDDEDQQLLDESTRDMEAESEW